ncbi:Kinase, NEK [Spironucleus salmonicida]|uniref:non-specific serine/threonine protein kinase n=1 Tax=Spironucleus salmonicida TaxID=348837 RepID=V6LB84_9EUKA|nr:Kinase, NEK [Spironucleus salmonicida]|eukprot:EST41695.1 Kinase, NEK [Spironucleus salmonicida]
MPHSTLADFELLNQVGKGSFGTVFKARRKKDGGIYCLKEIRLQGASQAEIQTAVNECNLLASIDSPYVVKYFDSFVDQSTETLWMVMEFASKGSLRDLIVKTPYISEEDAWYYISQMLVGIGSLHAKHIIHRDIKSLNIFVHEEADKRLSLKIGDMGVSKQLNSTTVMAQTLVGSPYYLSPEICRSEKYNMKSDIWAIGITFYEMLNNGKHPFLANNQAALLINILKGKYKQLPEEKYSQILRHLVYWCLSSDVTVRPDVYSLLALKPVADAIQRNGIQIPKDLQEAINKAKQHLSRLKSSDNTRSQQAIRQAQPVAPKTQPIQRKPEPKIEVEIELEEDVIDMTPTYGSQSKQIRIQEYNDDFDDDEEEQRPETSVQQKQLQDLINQQDTISKEQDKIFKEITPFNIPPHIRDDLINWFIQNTKSTEDQISKYVFGKIGYDKVSSVQFLRQYSDLQRKKMNINNEINEVMKQVKK